MINTCFWRIFKWPKPFHKSRDHIGDNSSYNFWKFIKPLSKCDIKKNAKEIKKKRESKSQYSLAGGVEAETEENPPKKNTKIRRNTTKFLTIVVQLGFLCWTWEIKEYSKLLRFQAWHLIYTHLKKQTPQGIISHSFCLHANQQKINLFFERKWMRQRESSMEGLSIPQEV